MSKILIISVTPNNNFVLAGNIKKVLDELGAEAEILNLHQYALPVYTPETQVLGTPNEAIELAAKFKNAKSLIFCCPEYNGGIPPILVNAIAWISVSGDKDWRQGFNGKVTLITSHSSGMAAKMTFALQTQLQHLGAVVLPRQIVTTSEKAFNEKSAKTILGQLVKLSH